MLNENSLMTDIALEAKDVSYDVRQIEMAIEASVKHVDNTISSISLGGVSEFVDNYPVPKLEVSEGYVGFAIDASKNEYDVTNIYEKQTYLPAQEEFFQYNGLIPMTEAWRNIEMFSNSITVQRNYDVLSFAGPDGKTLKRVTSEYAIANTFMFHGYNYGYEDLYMCSLDTPSGYRIQCYDNQGNLSKTVRLNTQYITYKGFCFDGKNFYSLSIRGNVTYIDKYDSEGVLIGDVAIPSTSSKPINIISTNNYLLCVTNSLSLASVIFDKDLKFVSNIARPSSASGVLSKLVPLFGFDCVYGSYADQSIVCYDLVKKTSEVVSISSNSYISYFGSYCLLVAGRLFSKLDYKGKSFAITKPNTPSVFQGMASNGSMIMGITNYNGYSYTDLADTTLACLAKKRG